MERLAPQRRIPAAWALLGAAALLGIVGLTPFGAPSEAVSQVAPPPPPPPPAPPPPPPAGANPDAAAFPVPVGFPQEDLSQQTAEMADQKSFGCVQCHHG